MGPESRGSKNSFCPRRAAAGEARYLLVVSTVSAGSGESDLITAHSWREKPSLAELSFSEVPFFDAPWRFCWAVTVAPKFSDAIANNAKAATTKPKHPVNLRMVYL